MLKMNEIKDWEDKIIDGKVSDIRRELFNIRMQKTTSGVEKPHRLREAKKDIARLLTVKKTRQNKQ